VAVSYIAASTADVGTASTTSYNITIPATAQVGDLAVVLNSTERNTIIPDTPSGWTPLRSEAATANHATMIAWKTLVTGEPGAALALTASANRRMASVMVVYRGVDTTAIAVVNGPYTNANTSGNNLDITSPSATPAVDDSAIVCAITSTINATPWSQTFTVDATYNLRGQDTSTSTTAGNPQSAIATHGLSGGAGVSQAGAVFTGSVTAYNAWASTITLPPVAAPQPWTWTHNVTIG
jgi:hypothetical protein